MVNPAVIGYLEIQKARQKLYAAEQKLDAAYLAYQRALKQIGPFPRHGWEQQRLAAHEDAVGRELENYKLVVSQVSVAFSCVPLRPPF